MSISITKSRHDSTCRVAKLHIYEVTLFWQLVNIRFVLISAIKNKFMGYTIFASHFLVIIVMHKSILLKFRESSNLVGFIRLAKSYHSFVLPSSLNTYLDKIVYLHMLSKIISLKFLIFFNLPTAGRTSHPLIQRITSSCLIYIVISIFCHISMNVTFSSFHLYIIMGLVQYYISLDIELKYFITLQVLAISIYIRWINLLSSRITLIMKINVKYNLNSLFFQKEFLSVLELVFLF